MSRFVSDRYREPVLKPQDVDVPEWEDRYEAELRAVRDRAVEDLGAASHDVLAWCYAAARLEATRVVADEREHAAAQALRDEGYSIREIADIMAIGSSTRVTRLLAGSPKRPSHEGPGHLLGHISSALVAPDETLEAQEYHDAHDAAFRRFPAAQGDYEMGYDGLSLKRLGRLISPTSRAGGDR